VAIRNVIAGSARYSGGVALRDAVRAIRFRDLEEEIERLDGIVRSGHEGPGFVLGALLPNRVEYPLAYLAAFTFGYPIVPLGRGLPDETVAHVVGEAGVTTLLVDGGTAPACRGLERLCRVVVLEDPGPARRARPRSVSASSSTLASINYTSGTTGRVKGVMLSQRNYLAACRNLLAGVGDLERAGQVLHVLPFSHSTAALLLPALTLGLMTTVAECGRAADVAAAAARFRPEVTVLSPALIGDLVDLAGRDMGLAAKMSSLDTILYGSSPIGAARLKKAMALLGPVFVQVYGMTETLPPVAVLDKPDHARAADEADGRLLSSCGRPARGVEVRLAGMDGRDAGPGEAGEILVRGDNVMEGYLGMREETERFLAGGWAHTGDMGRMEEGYLFLLGRKSSMIVREGETIFPLEIENAVSSVEGVKECAVFDPPGGSEASPFCAVVLEEGCGGPEALRRALELRLPSGRMPGRIIVLDRLPRNANGKPDRERLREPLKKAEQGIKT
jgi:acyl-CoA synthetase (AMP-forming)/AMP-acid ligase II